MRRVANKRGESPVYVGDPSLENLTGGAALVRRRCTAWLEERGLQKEITVNGLFRNPNAKPKAKPQAQRKEAGK